MDSSCCSGRCLQGNEVVVVVVDVVVAVGGVGEKRSSHTLMLLLSMQNLSSYSAGPCQRRGMGTWGCSFLGTYPAWT